MAEVKVKKPKTDSSWTFVDILKTFVPLLGIFGAFCYVLGRSYIESYYDKLGISSEVLTFSTYDYMFSSVTIVIFCLFISFLFFSYWEFSQTGKKLILDCRLLDRKNKIGIKEKRRVYIIVSLIVLVIIGCGTYLGLSFVSGDLCNQVWIIICSALILLLGLVLFTDIVQCISRITWKKSFRSSTGLRVVSAIFIGILIFLLTMVPVDVLAKSQAESDELTFPEVRIHYSIAFPAQMQSGTSDIAGFLDGQLITTNNEIVYVLKLFKFPEDTDYRNIIITPEAEVVSVEDVELEGVVGEYEIYRLVYAIPADSITGIIYYSER